MNVTDSLQGMDLYLLDLILKEVIQPHHSILDAGCGYGRNIHFFIREGYDVWGFDPDIEAIQSLRLNYPQQENVFVVNRIENFVSSAPFNVVICNAVLHFAENHSQFKEQFTKLSRLVGSSGILFIRMTSAIGLEATVQINPNGRAVLPDGSERYLLDRTILGTLLEETGMEYAEPLKTVNVDNLRCMSTLVLRKR